MSSPQRIPAKERLVTDIKPEDTRVGIVGTVVDFKGSTVVVDDGTGKAEVSFEEPPAVRAGQIVRVFGRAMPADAGITIQGEILQDFGDADTESYRKVSRMWESSLKEI